MSFSQLCTCCLQSYTWSFILIQVGRMTHGFPLHTMNWETLEQVHHLFEEQKQSYLSDRMVLKILKTMYFFNHLLNDKDCQDNQPQNDRYVVQTLVQTIILIISLVYLKPRLQPLNKLDNHLCLEFEYGGPVFTNWTPLKNILI